MIAVWDVDYTRNRLFHLFQLEGKNPEETPKEPVPDTPAGILEPMLDYAAEQGLMEDNTTTERDLFDPKIMDCLVPRPSEVTRDFYHAFEKQGPKAATDRFYQLSKDAHYIRTDRIAKNKHWYSETGYGDLEITINLSKPEKDPKAIAAAKNKKADSYPDCLLCKENVGYAGRLDHPGSGQPPRHSCRFGRRALVPAVFALCLLQRTCHCVITGTPPDEDFQRRVRPAA